MAQGRSTGLDGARGQKPWWDKVWGGRLQRAEAAPSSHRLARGQGKALSTLHGNTGPGEF